MKKLSSIIPFIPICMWIVVIICCLGCESNRKIEPPKVIYKLDEHDHNYTEHCKNISRIITAAFDRTSFASFRKADAKEAIQLYLETVQPQAEAE
jgi:hypothetical protein